MDVRRNLIISWVVFASGLAIASFLEGNWPFIAIGISGWLGNHFRAQIPKQKPERLGEYLERYPRLKWFTVIYLLIMAGLSLNYIGEFSEISLKTNPALLMLVLFFPFLILWLKQDYTIYVNSKQQP